MTDNKTKRLGPALRAAFPVTTPVLAGFLVLGIAYGVLMNSKGYGAIWSFLMSAVAFGGSMQFVAITLLTTAFDPISAFLLSLMVNARHLFYGLSMLEKYRDAGRAKFFLIFTLCDETFSLVSASEPPEGVDRTLYYLCVSALDYIYWVLGSVLGGLVGDLISFNTTGLDFSLTALFVVLFINQLRGRESRITGVIGLVCAAVALAVFGAENMVIPAMLMIVIALLAGRKKLCI